MTGDEIRAAQFRQARRGYNTADVDAFVERLAAAVERGEHLVELVRAAAFREAKRGYRTGDVDAFLDRAASG